MTRYIITFTPRIGSTWLERLLDSHPEIACNGEAFGKRQGTDMTWLGSENFLENIVFRHTTEHSTGCKVSGDQVLIPNNWRKTGWNHMWDLVVADPEIKIIHLNRRNPILQYVSMMIRKQGGPTKLTSEDRRVNRTVEVDVEEFLEITKRNRKEHERFKRELSNHPSIGITYEDMCNDTEHELRRVTEFLGVEYHPMESKLLKINNHPMRKTIRHYDNLRRKLRGTKWAQYLE